MPPALALHTWSIPPRLAFSKHGTCGSQSPGFACCVRSQLGRACALPGGRGALAVDVVWCLLLSVIVASVGHGRPRCVVATVLRFVVVVRHTSDGLGVCHYRCGGDVCFSVILVRQCGPTLRGCSFLTLSVLGVLNACDSLGPSVHRVHKTCNRASTHPFSN